MASYNKRPILKALRHQTLSECELSCSKSGQHGADRNEDEPGEICSELLRGRVLAKLWVGDDGRQRTGVLCGRLSPWQDPNSGPQCNGWESFPSHFKGSNGSLITLFYSIFGFRFEPTLKLKCLPLAPCQHAVKLFERFTNATVHKINVLIHYMHKNILVLCIFVSCVIKWSGIWKVATPKFSVKQKNI